MKAAIRKAEGTLKYELSKARPTYGYYNSADLKNPPGPSTGRIRVLRGGAWYYAADALRGTYRIGRYPTVANFGYGFRCAVDIP